MINVSMEGVKDAVDVLAEFIIPWQRKYAERKVKLENALRQAEVQRLNALTLAEKAKAEREQAAAEVDRAQSELLLSQAKKTEAEAKLILAQAEKIAAEANREQEAIRLEKIKLAMEIIEKYNPHVSNVEKVDYVIRLLHVLDRLLSSQVEVVETG